MLSDDSFRNYVYYQTSLSKSMERAQDLACKRYLGTQENFIQIVAIDAFLKGCLDKKADTDSSKPATVRTVYKKGATETDISNFDARLKKT
jgi:hypothetical protein